MTKTKEQEQKALDQIRMIISELGECSLVGTAFEGCVEVAENNINNDVALSLKQMLEQSTEKLRKEVIRSAHLSKENDELLFENKTIKKQLDRELEWHDFEETVNVRQSDYVGLTNNLISDEQAKEILYDQFGFVKEKVVILHNVSRYQVNRHHCFRKVDTYSRHPAYVSTDWNYIRFNCGTMMYELYNGSIRPFYD